MSTFAKAWALVKERISTKTSWGSLEVKNLMFECLQEAALENDEDESRGE